MGMISIQNKQPLKRLRFGSGPVLPVVSKPVVSKTVASKTIAIVDDFTPNNPESHGQLVAGVIRANASDVRIVPVHVEKQNGPFGPFYNIAQGLKTLVEKIQSGFKLDGVNLSMGDMLPFRTGQDLAQIKTQLMSRPASEKLSSMENTPTGVVQEGIQHLEALTQTHQIPVFIAAGNGGPNALNAYTLAKAVTGVGGLNPNGGVWEGSGNNPAVKVWEQATQTSQLENGVSKSVGPGTSFASPRALVKGLTLSKA
jgi:hypothetical protein